ncbi:hypothetical protein ACQP1K_25055 [Sphaerimonospora sp. CA-214678]|uniref:hypothetical protein n=1 Tax=Sphaerimonospora sp. CA-214678 TaxID=3240029 RepID=UPI003D8DCB3F
MLVADLVGETVDVQVHGVVQVSDPVYGVRPVVEHSEKAARVLAVSADLFGGIESLTPRHAVHDDQMLAQLGGLGAAPLLEFDHDVRVIAGTRMHSGEDDVDALAGQRKLVLHEHLDLVWPGVGHIACEGREAALPGLDLGGGGVVPTGGAHALGDHPRRGGLVGRGEQVLDRQPQRRHGLLPR